MLLWRRGGGAREDEDEDEEVAREEENIAKSRGAKKEDFLKDIFDHIKPLL